MPSFLVRDWWLAGHGRDVAVVMCGTYAITSDPPISPTCTHVFESLEFGQNRASGANGQTILATGTHSILVPSDWTGEDAVDGGVHFRLLSSPGPLGARTFVMSLARPLEERTLRDDAQATFERMRENGATGAPTEFRAGSIDGWLLRTVAEQAATPSVRYAIVITDQPLGYGIAVCSWRESAAADLPQCERALGTLCVTAEPPAR